MNVTISKLSNEINRERESR